MAGWLVEYADPFGGIRTLHVPFGKPNEGSAIRQWFNHNHPGYTIRNLKSLVREEMPRKSEIFNTMIVVDE